MKPFRLGVIGIAMNAASGFLLLSGMPLNGFVLRFGPADFCRLVRIDAQIASSLGQLGGSTGITTNRSM